MSHSHEERATFERWYREHHSRLLLQCRRILGDADAAEDIAQETLLRAWLGRDRMREEDLGAWLTVVARNLCISHMRRQKKQVPTEFLPERPDEAADPACFAERSESRRAVRRALRAVGERERELLLRREVEGLNYEELGAGAGLSAGGTRAILFRARRQLRHRLAAVGEGFGGWLVGVRVRARSWAHSVTRPMEVASQYGVNVAIGLGLTIVSLGGLPGGSAMTAANASSAAPPVASVLAPVASALNTGGRTATSGPIQARPSTPGGSHPKSSVTLTPGLTPGGDAHPGGEAPLLGEIDLGDISWRDRQDSPFPWEGSKVHKAESTVATRVCAEQPDLCE